MGLLLLLPPCAPGNRGQPVGTEAGRSWSTCLVGPPPAAGRPEALRGLTDRDVEVMALA